MLDQIYNDFVTKMLPKIQEGLVISKDYFFDLFGRYVKYLIVIDSSLLFISVIGIIVPPFILLKYKDYIFQKVLYRKWSWEEEREHYKREELAFISSVIVATIMALSVVLAISSGANLAKDIYIPEVRVYQTLKDINQ